MNGWRKVKLGELGEVVSGGTPKTKIRSFWDGNINWLTPKDFSINKNKYRDKGERSITEEGLAKSSAKLLPKGTILYTSRAPIGYIGIAKEKVSTNQGFKNLIVNSENYNEFIYYSLILKTSEIINAASGSTFKEISASEFKNIELFVPKELLTQKKCVKLLEDIDSKIELNNKINDNLEKQIQTIFKKMFPNIFYGKDKVGSYLIPARGKNLLTKNAINGTVPVIAGGLAPSTYHNIANTQSPVITISASGANAGYVNLWHIPVWSSDSSYIDSTINEYIYFWYVFLKLRQEEIYDLQAGTAQPHIYPKHISELSVNKIDTNLMKKFNNIASTFFSKIGENNIENIKLTNIKNILLPKLMNGEIDVDKIKI